MNLKLIQIIIIINQTKAKNADRQFKNLGLYSLSKIQNKSFNLNIINKNT